MGEPSRGMELEEEAAFWRVELEGKDILA